jgi:hypothetical protein
MVVLESRKIHPCAKAAGLSFSTNRNTEIKMEGNGKVYKEQKEYMVLVL